MSSGNEYLMEGPQEAYRLEMKTDPRAVREYAAWFGIGPGARVLDVGCGSGMTAFLLYEMVQPGGEVVGIDFSKERIRFAQEKYAGVEGLKFFVRDIDGDLDDLGGFDYIWVQFFLEYFQREAKDIIAKLGKNLKQGAALCLIDLDYNCLSHYPLPERMGAVLERIVDTMSTRYNFDPYVGRKLYTYLFESGYRDIRVDLKAHHLIYGEVRSQDQFNWIKKIEMASRKAEQIFQAYPGGYKGFFDDFLTFFSDPKRLTYTPLFLCRGERP